MPEPHGPGDEIALIVGTAMHERIAQTTNERRLNRAVPEIDEPGNAAHR
jgi:hypothetical protein